MKKRLAFVGMIVALCSILTACPSDDTPSNSGEPESDGLTCEAVDPGPMMKSGEVQELLPAPVCDQSITIDGNKVICNPDVQSYDLKVGREDNKGFKGGPITIIRHPNPGVTRIHWDGIAGRVLIVNNKQWAHIVYGGRPVPSASQLYDSSWKETLDETARLTVCGWNRL